MPTPRPLLVTASVAAIAACLAGPANAQVISSPPTVGGPTVVLNRALPGNDRARGLVYDGLAAESTGACLRLYRLVTTRGCTPGPEAPPAGLDVAVDVPKLPDRQPKLQCDGDGTAGRRVQVVYARASDVPNRYDDVADSIRQWAGQVDRNIRGLAGASGGERHVRFVHDADCVLDVDHITLTPAGDDSFDATIADLKAAGLSPSRKYLVFVDANVYCGIAHTEDDDRASASNLNQKGERVARVDAGCWGGEVATDQLLHTLGAVQLSAPHSSGDWHCTGSCGGSDFFDTDPPASGYLATHWNVADSEFLVRTPQNLWGYVAIVNPSLSYTPEARSQRNSTNALNHVQRTGAGAYTVTFPNLGVTGGTVNVTAMGYTTSPTSCKVADWGHSLADLQVRVRCFDTAGVATDSAFSATFARPGAAAPGRRFAYLWADQATNALYTPDPRYSYSSEGQNHAVTRSGTGRYRVQLGGVGGASGSANVTAYGTGNSTCKLVNWAPSGTDVLVDVVCHNAAGARIDSRFTLTFHAQDGIFGEPVPGGAPRAHVLASEPSNPAYTPLLAEQFNSGGGAITIRRSWEGWYGVRIPGFERLGGNAQVTALSSTGDSVRCYAAGVSTSWSSTSGPATDVSVRCHDITGHFVDAPFAMTFTG